MMLRTVTMTYTGRYQTTVVTPVLSRGFPVRQVICCQCYTVQVISKFIFQH